MKRSIFVLVLIFAFSTVATVLASAEEGQYDTALKLYYSGEFKQAADSLKDYVNSTPDPSAYYLIGYSLYKLGKFDEATQYFEQAYLIDPNFSPEESGLKEKFPENLPLPKNKKRAPLKKKSVQRAKKKSGGHMILSTKQNEKQTPPSQNQVNKVQKTAAPAPSKPTAGRVSNQSAPPLSEKSPQVQKTTQMNATKQSDKQPASKQAAQSNKPDQLQTAAATGLRDAAQQNAGQKQSSASGPAATQVQPAAAKMPAAVNKAQAGANTVAQQAKKAISGIMPALKDRMVLGGIAAAFAAVLLGTGLIVFLRKKRKTNF